MRERIKTLILLLLVANSILLTGRLLFGQPALETAALPAYEQLVFGELKPVTEHILPELRLRERDDWLILHPWDSGHNKAWGLLLELVRFGDEPETVLPPEVQDGPAVYAEFTTPAPIGLWLPNSRSKDLEVAGVAWFAAAPQTVWFSDEDGLWFASSLSFLPEGWEAQMKEAFDSALAYRAVPAEEWAPLTVKETTRVLIPRELPVYPAYSLYKEDLDAQRVIRSIFVNTSLVRRIEERGGAVIYTDGQRGLRLFDHGEIEYTSPKSEPGLEALTVEQALRRAAQYLQLMGGWPKHLFLQSEVTEKRFNTISFFSVQHGIRLESSKPAMKLRFSDRGVINYNRQVVQLGEPAGPEKKLIDPLALAEDVAAHVEQFNSGAALVHVYPALYTGRWPGRDVAQPAWVFLFDGGQTVVMHGYSGQVMALQE